MNEIVPQSPDGKFDFDDENSYVPETPQSVASPQTCNGIPIPSLTRIRRSLGVLDNSPPHERTPSLRQCCFSEKFSSDKKKASRFENCSQENLHFFKKVRVSLFHEKHKEKENVQVEKSFSINTKAFYGSSSCEEQKFSVTEPLDVKPVIAQTVTRKRIRPLFWSCSKQQTMKRHKAGEINCGVGHGIKKPKPNKKSPNNSIKSELKKISPKQVNIKKNGENKRLLKQADSKSELIEIYDPSKKFFKCKYVTRMKAKLIGALEDAENISDSANEKFSIIEDAESISDTANEKFSISEDNSCEAIENSPNLKSKYYTNQSDRSKPVECSTTSPLTELRKNVRSHGRDVFNMLTNNSNTLNKTAGTKSNHLNYFNTCNFSENDKTKQSRFLPNNIFSISETEKHITTHQSTNHTLSILEDNLTENVLSDKSAKKSEETSINDNQSKEEKVKPNKNLQSTVVNRSQYLINTKEDHFNTEECKECQEYNLIYKFSSENDKDVHIKYHNSFQNLKFEEWKNLRLVFEEPKTETKVILIKSEDYISCKTKLEAILNLVTEEINVDECVNLINNKNNKVYLLVKNDIIISILVAGITIIQDNMLCKPKIMFGVGFIWTAKSFRRQKIASKLIDVMRSNFDDDYRIEINRIAFSKKFLTPDGKVFGASYTKSSDLKVY